MVTCNNIKLRIFFLAGIASCILSPFDVNAQQKVSDVRVVVRDIRQEKDSVRAILDIETIGISVTPREQLYFFPVIRSGENEKKLLPVVIRGKTQQAVVNRVEKLSGEVEPVYVCFSTGRRKAIHEKITYNSIVSLEGWMKDANVAMVQERRNCRGEYHRISTEIIADSIRFMEKPERSLVYVLPVRIPVPPREEIKTRTETGEALIIYRVGNAEIDPGMGNNRNELDKIRRSLEDIKNVQGVDINTIKISAYASPEGTWQNNLRLSERRAASLTGWLRRNYDLEGITLSSQGYGEDWKGLGKLVEEDLVMTTTEKEYALGIIDKEEMNDRREQVLMQYNGGQSYRYMLTRLFPLLRRCAYRIGFTVPEYSVETIKEVYQTHPNMLSLYEFYLLANQYEPESPQFSDVIKKAAAMYPEEKINRLSMAVFSYLSGDMKAGLEYLTGLEDDPDAWLYLSAFHARNGELDKAEQYARRAAESGNTDAQEHLALIEKYKVKERQYQDKLKEYIYMNTKKTIK